MISPLSLSVGPRYCISCGSGEVQRSRRRNPLERRILPLLLMRPFRCGECGDRHYGFYFRKRANSVSQAASETSSHPRISQGTVSGT